MTLAETIIETLKEEDPRTIEEMIAEDTFGEVTVDATKHVGGRASREVEVTFDTSAHTVLEVPRGKRIKVGDTLRFYPDAHLGTRRHGWALNGELIEWKTPMERAADHMNWLAQRDREQREEFAVKRAKLKADYEYLPDPLKQRIDRFVAEKPTFWVDSGWYEMFCCTEAAKFAEAARNATDHSEADAFWADEGMREAAGGLGTVWAERPDSPEIRWLLWAWALNSEAYDYDLDRQKEVLGMEDGHSGNTFGGAMHLAMALLRGDEV